MTEPLPYPQFVWLMDMAYLILTGSGAIQEETPSLGKPVLAMRETTERPEGTAAGNVCLAGVEREAIVEETLDLLADEEQYRKMAMSANPFGDGQAFQRIVSRLLA